MSAAEMREAAAVECDNCPDMHWGPWLAKRVRALPLPDEEGMVERFVEAMWPVCTAHRLEAATSAGARYAVTGDVVRDLARAAIRAINGGEP